MNDTFNTIATAINQKKVIEFEYSKPDEPKGKRIGNPYVIYEFHAKDGTKTIKVDVFQTGWVSKSGNLPSFKMLDIDAIRDVSILDEGFLPDSTDYNQTSPRYSHPIVQIKL